MAVPLTRTMIQKDYDFLITGHIGFGYMRGGYPRRMFCEKRGAARRGAERYAADSVCGRFVFLKCLFTAASVKLFSFFVSDTQNVFYRLFRAWRSVKLCRRTLAKRVHTDNAFAVGIIPQKSRYFGCVFCI